jgi:hypothetical protein
MGLGTWPKSFICATKYGMFLVDQIKFTEAFFPFSLLFFLSYFLPSFLPFSIFYFGVCFKQEKLPLSERKRGKKYTESHKFKL